ncbi:hypothetical protein GCM10023328_45850 [Modestobacter marinus]|uniref:Integral membrane protein n=1 Tax=Modestobacter marinus TaxID=477641 RepID=A0A846LEB8_9ACTN|nr:ABC transporter permease [Modestobacter marinus]NIH66036.1 hypothetical protein [Modestobacter marinus]GGL84731.1 hypothetical protein GCM10011589_46480 [Modestobacter marinus]
MPGGFSPPPGPAQAGVELERSNGSRPAALARGVGVPALVATLIGLAFVMVFLDAFHAAVPHDLPVAVVGSTQQVESVATALEQQDPGGLSVRSLPDEAAARAAVRQADVYGALLLEGPQPRLLVAGAHGQGVTQTLTQAFGPVAEGLEVVDLRPLASGDTRGLGIFYGAFGVVLGGFLFGITSYQAAPKLPLRWRVLSILLFATVSGLLVAWAAGVLFDAVPAGFGVLALLVGLLALAVAAPAALMLRAIGSGGTFVTSLGLIILGNATSTGNLPAQYLPPWMQPLADVLPPGVAVRALRGAAYFADDGVVRALWVLALWSIVPLLLIALLDAVRRRRGAGSSGD